MEIFGFKITKAEPKSQIYGSNPNIENYQMGGSIFRERISTEALYQVYKKNSDISSCINWIQNRVFSQGYRFIKDKETIDYIEAENILNSITTFTALKKDIVRDLKITGNAYIEKVKGMFNNKVVGLKTIDPRTLSIITDSIGQPLRYIQRVGGCVVGFEVNEIIHIKEGQDVDISIFGKSPIEGVFLEAKTDEEVEVSNYALNKNKMSPSNIFTLKEGLSAEAQERALDVIQATLKGSENTGRSISLPEIDKVIQMRLTNSEMQVLEFRKFSTEKICSALGLSKFLLGYTDGVNNNNGVELREGAYIDTIEPTEDTISSALTRQLFFPLFGIQFEAIEQDIGVKQRHEIGIRELERGAITRIEYREKMSYDVDKKDKKGGEYREV